MKPGLQPGHALEGADVEVHPAAEEEDVRFELQERPFSHRCQASWESPVPQSWQLILEAAVQLFEHLLSLFQLVVRLHPGHVWT